MGATEVRLLSGTGARLSRHRVERVYPSLTTVPGENKLKSVLKTLFESPEFTGGES